VTRIARNLVVYDGQSFLESTDYMKSNSEKQPLFLKYIRLVKNKRKLKNN